MSGGAGHEARDQRLAEAVVGGMLADDAFSRWLGVEVAALAPRSATLRMTVRDDMLNGFGVCHGGVTFSLADSALAFASNTHGRVTMSVENAIGYPAPARAGDVLTAHAVEESANGPLAFYRVDVARADGTAIAHFRGTVYRTRREHAAAAGMLTTGDEGNG
ncbi:MAG: hydroxyphenylacetyl-CoA thioesterase PaaI [Gemmatimonadaceae bacterium]|nr:hydroxyphenylacetyl-CoA thioesterase PaaI [Gemmatimonadaceae bacterium]